jgi:NADH-quinone oxidoreductase subunit J
MPDITFLVLTTITLVAGIMALQSKELIYGAISLAISFVGIAGFFVSLDAPYLAMLQIAVYAGAVVVLILFTIMLVRRDKPDTDEMGQSSEGAAGLWIAGLLAVSIAGIAALAGPNLPASPPAGNLPISQLGPVLAGTYPVPLIILALLLSGALIGALVLAKVDR